MRRNRLVAAVVAGCAAFALAGIAHPADARTGSGASYTPVTSSSSVTGSAGTVKAGSYQTVVKPAAHGKAADSARNKTTITSATSPYDDCVDTDGKPYATGLPALPCLPNGPTGSIDLPSLYHDYGATLGQTFTSAPKAKITFSLPELTLRAFDVVCISPLPPTFPTCPFNLHFPTQDTSVTDNYYGTAAVAWVQSPKGVTPKYGVFPAVDVSMLAFGSIPVTATVHISQTYHDGLSSPQSLKWFQSATIKPNKVVPGYEKYGPSPDNGQTNFFSPPAGISGPVVVRIDNVKVDGVPLSVGAGCQTSADLRLGAPGGFYDGNSVAVRGAVGGYRPLFNGTSYLSGSVDLPAFAGCHNGTENLDPLITGMVSGPDNTVDTTQTTDLRPYGCLVNPDAPDCATLHPALSGSKPTHRALAQSATAYSGAAKVAEVERYQAFIAEHADELPSDVRRILARQAAGR